MAVSLDTEDRITRATAAIDGFVEMLALIPSGEQIEIRKATAVFTVLTDELTNAFPKGWSLRARNDAD